MRGQGQAWAPASGQRCKPSLTKGNPRQFTFNFPIGSWAKPTWDLSGHLLQPQVALLNASMVSNESGTDLVRLGRPSDLSPGPVPAPPLGPRDGQRHLPAESEQVTREVYFGQSFHFSLV